MMKEIRGWRVRPEGHGLMVFFDPSLERLALHDGPAGPDLAGKARECSEAEAESAHVQDPKGRMPDPLQFPLFTGGP